MRARSLVAIRTLAAVLSAALAFTLVRSDNQIAEVIGATVLIALAAWMIVALFRLRKQVLRE